TVVSEIKIFVRRSCNIAKPSGTAVNGFALRILANPTFSGPEGFWLTNDAAPPNEIENGTDPTTDWASRQDIANRRIAPAKKTEDRVLAMFCPLFLWREPMQEACQKLGVKTA